MRQQRDVGVVEAAGRSPDRRARALMAAALLLVGSGAVTAASGALQPSRGRPARVATADPTTTAPTTVTTSSTSTTTTTVARPAPVVTTAPPATTTVTSPPRTTTVAPVATASAPACPTGGCITVDAATPTGPVDHAGAGFNLLPSADTNSRELSNLGATMYRSVPAPGSAGLYNWGSWSAASASGARTTLILSDLWAQTAKNGGPPPTPWSNWSAYTSWVRSTVQNVLASGQRVDYWDVYNEPGWNNYYSAADFASETPDDLLQQFLVSYQAIKSVDPGAAIVGPSIGEWSLTPLPPNNLTHEPDLGTFLRFAAMHGLQLAAVAWHDNGKTPATIYADAEATWNLIRSLPGLGHPQMFLDEYGSRWTQPVPGWDVGYLSTIARAGIASAERSCWDSCTLATLDGLLTDGGQARTSDYWVRSTYAEMTGQTAASSTSTDSLAALGSIDSSHNQVVALIGRLQGCAVASWCNTEWRPRESPVPPADVRVHLIVPWTTDRPAIQLSSETFQPGAAVSGPTPAAPASLTVTPAGPGATEVSFTIPSFPDGAAYNLLVTPGS